MSSIELTIGSSHHQNTESKQGNMEKSGGHAGRVPISSILVDQGQGSRKIKLECDEFTEDNLGHVSVKVENDWSANDGATGDEGHEETSTVTEEEIDAILLSPAEDPDGQGQRSSCSCQQEIEILKCSLRQLAFQTEKQTEMFKRQNQIIGGIKSCIRNYAVSFTTFCDTDDDEDVDNLEELEIVEAAGSTVEDPQQFKNSYIMSNNPRKINPDNFPDNENCSPVTIVNCTGNYSGSIRIPSVPSFASSASFETFKNEAGYILGQRSNEDKTADVNVNNANLDDDDDKDSSYVLDESEKEADQEIEDENSNHGATTTSTKSVIRKGDFKCGKCCKSFKWKKYLDQHLGRVHPRKRIKCHLCPKLFTDARYLRNHILSIHEGVGYQCSYCPGKFNNMANVRRHEDKVHKKGGPLRQQCEICGIQLLDSNSLHIHMSKMHKNLEFSLKPKRAFNTPAITFQTKKGFQYQLCPASFLELEGLHSHQSQAHAPTSTFGAEAD